MKVKYNDNYEHSKANSGKIHERISFHRPCHDFIMPHGRVVWEMLGFFHHEGKDAYDNEIENPNADGHPEISITRLVEEGDIVIAEGTVKAKLKDGNKIDAVFCDVFHFANGKISKLTTYLMFNK